MEQKFDIFISYKRKSLPTANNLYYRLTTRGYSTFFDLEEMRRDNFNVQLLDYIEHANDVFVIIEEGSLDACKSPNWKEDWFCREIAYALEKKKNIIPILLGGYEMPSMDFFPDELKELRLKNAPEFNFSYFEAYLDKLIAKKYLLSTPTLRDNTSSVFKFYSNEDCQVFKEGKLVCSLEGMSETPYYLPIKRKGDYRFTGINSTTGEKITIKNHIDADEEKDVDIIWERLKPISDTPKDKIISDPTYSVNIGMNSFNMIRVEGGELFIGATPEQQEYAEDDESPAHKVNLSTFYISQFPITQNIWRLVMGYNKSRFEEGSLFPESGNQLEAAIKGGLAGLPMGLLGVIGGSYLGWQSAKEQEGMLNQEKGHYPAENLTYDEAQEFVRRLSVMTNIQFALPTEEEWEYAARGGQQSLNFIYAGSNNLDEVAWYSENSDRRTHPVGEKKPNELGLYDMCGNVWEWTETPAHSYGLKIEVGGDVYIRRGGSWWHEARNCRVSRRNPTSRMKKTSGLGLRVVIRTNIR